MLNITINETDEYGQPIGQELSATVVTIGPEPKVIEVSVKAMNGTGLTALPDLDLMGLIKAIAPSVTQTFEPPATVLETTTAPSISKPAKQARKTTAKKTAAAKKTTAKKTTAEGGRVYRRMPANFAEVVAELGESQSALAKRFDVPAHTVNGWLRTYRKNQGTPASTSTTLDE